MKNQIILLSVLLTISSSGLSNGFSNVVKAENNYHQDYGTVLQSKPIYGDFAGSCRW